MVISAHSQAYRTRIINFRDLVEGSFQHRFEYFEDGVLVIENGKVKLVASATSLMEQGYDLSHCEHYPHFLCCAGFIDAHVHAGQLAIIASYGEQLMNWLTQYTFPAELQFADPEYSHVQSQHFIRQLLVNGVTSASVFSTCFSQHAQDLFIHAAEINMRLIVGRVMMDRNAPSLLCDTADSASEQCRKLIRKWHGHKRLSYAITPRFAGTSTPQQLHNAGNLLAEVPDLILQTHLSENEAEIAWTKSLFPEAKDYLQVYENYGLATERSLFAHCVHLTKNEMTRLRDHGSRIAFCPSSNCFLGSGLFPYARIKEKGIPIALGSDVGAGTSLSPFATMADAYKVCQLKGYALSALEAFYLCTLGAARSLHLDRFIGSLCPGKEADFIFINPQRSAKVAERVELCRTIEEELFVYMLLGDERIIERSYLHGECRYSQKF